MFERFTERARAVVFCAQETARSLNHEYIGTEHLLIGLAADKDALSAKALAHFDLDEDCLRDQLAATSPAGADEVKGQIPFTPRAKKVLELALREALSMGCNYIGTEHVLLAALREWDGLHARILSEIGIDPVEVRTEVMRLFDHAKNPHVARPKPKPVPAIKALGWTRLVLKNGQAFTMPLDIDMVMNAVHESGDGLIGFRCVDERMHYVAKDQIALVEPDRTEGKDAA